MEKRDRKHLAILSTACRLFRTQGFGGTSMSQITREVGGSRATLYSHFPSKEELFVECMAAAAENYLAGSLQRLGAAAADPAAALRDFGRSLLTFLCAPEQVEVRRTMIAEAARSGIGKLFFTKVTSLRTHVARFLGACMASGTLRPDDPDLAAEQLAALLEAETLVPLLLRARDATPDAEELGRAVDRAVSAFLRAYGPDGPGQCTMVDAEAFST